MLGTGPAVKVSRKAMTLTVRYPILSVVTSLMGTFVLTGFLCAGQPVKAYDELRKAYVLYGSQRQLNIIT